MRSRVECRAPVPDTPAALPVIAADRPEAAAAQEIRLEQLRVLTEPHGLNDRVRHRCMNVLRSPRCLTISAQYSGVCHGAVTHEPQARQQPTQLQACVYSGGADCVYPPQTFTAYRSVSQSEQTYADSPM